MKKSLLLICIIIFTAYSKPNYSSWSYILNKYVCNEGVDYKNLKNDTSIITSSDQEFKSLSENEFKELTKNEQLAWLINLYNFYTIKLIIENLPLKVGIRDINKPWDQKIVPLFSNNVSLNHIEHQIIRKQYDEPRIHFALVCASKGCPQLSNKLFTGENLDTLLDRQGKEFLNDKTRNRVEGKKLFLSEIFSWYGGDFKERYGSYKNFVLKALKLEGKYSVKFISYDWSLNITEKCDN